MSLFTTSFRVLVTNVLPPIMRSQGVIDFISSLVGGLDTDMSATNIYNSDILIKSKINSQIIVFRAGLIYLTGINGIYITTGNSLVSKTFVFRETEGITNPYLYRENESSRQLFLYRESETPDVADFTIFIPLASYTTPNIQLVTSWAKQFKLAGKSFITTSY